MKDNPYCLCLPVPSHSLKFLQIPSNTLDCRERAAFRQQEVRFFLSTSSSDRTLFSSDPDAKHIYITSNLSKALAQPLALTFPDTSLFIKVVKRLERKIDERLRSSTSRIAVNGLGFNEMHLLASFAESVVPTHDRGLFCC
jgi:hypothetical protein